MAITATYGASAIPTTARTRAAAPATMWVGTSTGASPTDAKAARGEATARWNAAGRVGQHHTQVGLTRLAHMRVSLVANAPAASHVSRAAGAMRASPLRGADL